MKIPKSRRGSLSDLRAMEDRLDWEKFGDHGWGKDLEKGGGYEAKDFRRRLIEGGGSLRVRKKKEGAGPRG